MKVKAGTCVYMPRPPNTIAHLYMILTDPDKKGDVLMVNATSSITADDTTVLTPTDHPFFTKDKSYIHYADTINCKAANIEIVFEKDSIVYSTGRKYNYRVLEDATSATLKKVQDGLYESDFTPQKMEVLFDKAKEENRIGGVLTLSVEKKANNKSP